MSGTRDAQPARDPIDLLVDVLFGVVVFAIGALNLWLVSLTFQARQPHAPSSLASPPELASSTPRVP